MDEEKTAFSSLHALFEFNVIPFVLTNALATFQQLMECTLSGLIPEQCLIYLYDIIVYSVTFEDHFQRLKAVFQRLQDAGLQMKPGKYHFTQPKLQYLGHVVSCSGVHLDPKKLDAVQSFPRPSSIKQPKMFLGMVNYYCRFINDYAKLADPLHRLTRKAVELKWTDAMSRSI